MPSIFTKIIAGEIPSHKIYEDDSVYAFLSIEPNNLGHTLLVPKEEIGNILDLPDDLLLHLMLVAKNTLAPAIQRATECARVGFAIEGFGVSDHMHIHLIPLFQSGDMDMTKAHSESPENMSMIAKKIRACIL